MVDILLIAGAEVINTNDFMALDQLIAQMGTQKSRPTRNHNIFFVERS